MSHNNYNDLMELLGGKEYQRIEVEGYIPLSVERVGKDLISVCHYDEMNGDLMADPECVFLVADGKALPAYYRSDYALGLEHATVEGYFGDVPVKPYLQKELDTFVSMWFENLREEGFFEQARQHAQEEQEQDHDISR
jgi:hypothetical protein